MESNNQLRTYQDTAKAYQADGQPAVARVIKALGVLVLTPAIRQHLAVTDPQALLQAEIALAGICTTPKGVAK